MATGILIMKIPESQQEEKTAQTEPMEQTEKMELTEQMEPMALMVEK